MAKDYEAILNSVYKGIPADHAIYPDTFLLPGFSLKNKEWAEEVREKLKPEIPVIVFYWPHWETGEKEEDWIEKEADKILEQAKATGGMVNILAKSIGTIVAMRARER